MYFFLTKDEKLFKKYNEILKNVSSIIKKQFDSNPVYNEKYVKSKMKVYNQKINTDGKFRMYFLISNFARFCS